MATADRNQPNRSQDAAPAAADAPDTSDALLAPPDDTAHASDAPASQVIILDADATDADDEPPNGAADLLDDERDREGDADAAADAEIDEDGRRPQPAHEFLVPGPDATSDSGTLRWGLTWVLFSLLLILFMLAVSFVCWLLAVWTGLG